MRAEADHAAPVRRAGVATGLRWPVLGPLRSGTVGVCNYSRGTERDRNHQHRTVVDQRAEYHCTDVLEYFRDVIDAIDLRHELAMNLDRLVDESQPCTLR